MSPDFRPGRFIVSHFFNPPPLIPLVELVGNKHTNPECLKWLKELLIQCGKSPIVLKDFVKGFFANRVQGAAGRETMYLVNKGIISIEDAESVNMSFMGIKCSVQGQFTQYDHIGLDTVALVHSVITPDLCTSHEVSPLIKEKVNAGKLGIKTGEGFFKYEGDKATEAVKKREVMMLEQLKFYNKYWKKAD